MTSWGVVLAIVVAAGATPEVISPQTGAARRTEVPGARSMPAVETVCVDRERRRCWVVGGESQCREVEAGSAVFRVVLVKDTAVAVGECRREVAGK